MFTHSSAMRLRLERKSPTGHLDAPSSHPVVFVPGWVVGQPYTRRPGQPLCWHVITSAAMLSVERTGRVAAETGQTHGRCSAEGRPVRCVGVRRGTGGGEGRRGCPGRRSCSGRRLDFGDVDRIKGQWSRRTIGRTRQTGPLYRFHRFSASLVNFLLPLSCLPLLLQGQAVSRGLSVEPMALVDVQNRSEHDRIGLIRGAVQHTCCCCRIRLPITHTSSAGDGNEQDRPL